MLADRLKLTDPDGRVSLTNISVWVVLLVIVYSVARTGSLVVTLRERMPGVYFAYFRDLDGNKLCGYRFG